MKKLLLIALCFFSFAACDCTTTKYYPSGDTTPVASEEMRTAPRQGRRGHNKSLMTHIEDRTVFIAVDCTPKDGVVVVGVNNPKLYGDGSGTGIIVRSKEGISYLFTAAHVIEFSEQKEAEHFDCVINVQRTPDTGTSRGKHIASVVASDSDHDVAVLSVPVNFGVNTELELDPFTGEDIWAAGFPALLVAPGTKILSITKGTLATKNIPIQRNSRKYGHWHRVTAQLYFGNSGGGVWSKSGKLIAIVSALAAEGKLPYEGNYFVKPIQEALNLLSRKGKYEEVFYDVK